MSIKPITLNGTATDTRLDPPASDAATTRSRRHAHAASAQPYIARHVPSRAAPDVSASGRPAIHQDVQSVVARHGSKGAAERVDSTESTLTRFANELADSQSLVGTITSGGPTASDALSDAISRYFGGSGNYSEMERAHGPQWASRVSVDGQLGPAGSRDGQQLKVRYTDPATGAVSTPPLLNDAVTRRELAQRLAGNVKTRYQASQDAYWSHTSSAGVPRTQKLQQAMRLALKAEAGMRITDGSLSPEAHSIVKNVFEESAPGAIQAPVASSRDAQASTKVSRLVVNDENVPGAFVFSRQRDGGPVVLWRLDQPLQEFKKLRPSAVRARLTWVLHIPRRPASPFLRRASAISVEQRAPAWLSRLKKAMWVPGRQICGRWTDHDSIMTTHASGMVLRPKGCVKNLIIQTLASSWIGRAQGRMPSAVVMRC